MQKIGIIGAGSWGTALAQTLAEHNKSVLLWAHEADVVKDINGQSLNTRFLPGISLHANIQATDSLQNVAQSDLILIATPAQFVRQTLKALKPLLPHGQPLVICSKGIEIETGLLLSQVAKQEVPDNPVGMLSGPTFALEIAKGQPSAVTLAVEDNDIGQEIIDSLNTRNLRLYSSNDLVGVQIGGAVKNVIAIACGVAHGLKMGESTRASLMTRGLAEMSRLVSAMDGQRTTLMGMCGMGDLVLTCSSLQSRNFSFGYELGRGRKIDDILNEREGGCVTEGYYTSKALHKMAQAHAVDMPISLAAYECMHEGKTLRDAINDLLDRPSTSTFRN